MTSEQTKVETEDEKRRRRLAKRAAKEARRRDDSLLAGYSNSANPWNDPNLDDQFVWNKKVQRVDAEEERTGEGSIAHKKQRRQLADELLKVKEAREQREREREDWEKERRELDRQREQMSYDVNEKREDAFQLRQEHSRALKRVEEGRARPVDILAASLAALLPDGPTLECTVPCEALVSKRSAPQRRVHSHDDTCGYCSQDPLLMLDESGENELRELLTDCSRIGELDAAHSRFWGAMAHVCEEALQASLAVRSLGHGDLPVPTLSANLSWQAPEARLSSMQRQVRDEIDDMLQQKSTAELDDLERQIAEQRQQVWIAHAGSREARVDVAASPRSGYEHRLLGCCACPAKANACASHPSRRIRRDAATTGGHLASTFAAA
jgi:hypothetical protein